MKLSAFAPLALLFLTACQTVGGYTQADAETGLYAKPIGTSTVGSRSTPYSAGLQCVGSYLRSGKVNRARIAVGRISDFTGKQELEGGFKITQGASLMAMSALSKAGVVLVERFDTSVSELELKFTNNRLIGDRGAPVRTLRAGTVAGSDFFLVGGITELNYNIRSSGVDGFGGGASARGAKGFVNANSYVMDISLDLRLVDTKSMLVVDVTSYQKQIVGREVSAGVFSFFGNALFDVSAGTSAHEPIQYAVRAVVERAVLDMVSKLYDVGPEICARQFNPGGRSLAERADEIITERANPNRWHEERDPAIRDAVQWTAAPARSLTETPEPSPADDASATRQPKARPAPARPDHTRTKPKAARTHQARPSTRTASAPPPAARLIGQTKSALMAQKPAHGRAAHETDTTPGETVTALWWAD